MKKLALVGTFVLLGLSACSSVNGLVADANQVGSAAVAGGVSTANTVAAGVGVLVQDVVNNVRADVNAVVAYAQSH